MDKIGQNFTVNLTVKCSEICVKLTRTNSVKTDKEDGD